MCKQQMCSLLTLLGVITCNASFYMCTNSIITITGLGKEGFFSIIYQALHRATQLVPLTKLQLEINTIVLENGGNGRCLYIHLEVLLVEEKIANW